jgi:hypothetical protein
MKDMESATAIRPIAATNDKTSGTTGLRAGEAPAPGPSCAVAVLNAPPQLEQNLALFLHDSPQLGQRNKSDAADYAIKRDAQTPHKERA